MKKQNSPTSITSQNKDLQKKIASSITIHDNLVEKYLQISESKIKLCLKDNMENMEDRKAWQVPAGIAFTIFITLITSNFKDKILPSQTWQAIFIVVGLFAVIWLVISLFQIPKKKSVNDIVDELMHSTVRE